MNEKAKQQTKQGEIKITFPEKLHGGVYANQITVMHTPEEFVIDFQMVAPPVGAVTSRVIVSPGHMKRLIHALKDNLAKFESSHGEIKVTAVPKGDSTLH